MQDKINKVNRESIESIVAEFVSLGGAFAEDDWGETSDGDEYYNPTVDRENAEMWLRDKLQSLL